MSIAPNLYAFGKSAKNILRKKDINLARAFMNIDGVQVVAASDVYGRKRERFQRIVKDFYADKKMPTEVKTYEHYHFNYNFLCHTVAADG